MTMELTDKNRLIARIRQHIAPGRYAKIAAIAGERTRYITVVLNHIHYTQNLSAIVRTCECLGIQDVHITGETSSARINKHVAIGASNWITVHRKNLVPESTVLEELKTAGYRLVAAVPDPAAVPLPDFDVEKGRAAVILGSESSGISAGVRNMADEFITIPMSGFSNSLNISVSAAVILYALMDKLRHSAVRWQLSEAEALELQYEWIKLSMRRGEEIGNEYITRLAHPNDQ